MPSRSYGQYCAVAKSLDIVGDRWTLLIVRDLLDGPRRYGDLHAALSPIATDMLAGRLRRLEQHGLVCRRELVKPQAGSVYELTADGCALEDVVNALARWGRYLIATREPEDVVRPQWLVRAVRAYVRPDRTGPDLVLRLAAPDGGATIRIGANCVAAVGDDTPADVTLTGQIDVLLGATDPARVDDLVAAGRLHVAGDPAAVRRLAGIFESPRIRSVLV